MEDEVEQRRRAAVVGLGPISGEHLAFLRASSRAELVGVCDLSVAIARYMSEQVAAPWFTDVATMLDAVEPSVVHVLTPPWAHVGVAEVALAGGCHVIVEKPITLNTSDLRQLLEVAARHGRDITEDHNYLYNDEVVALRRLVSRGALGAVREVDVEMAVDLTEGAFGDEHVPHPIHGLPAGALHDVITHLCYLALAFLDEPVDDVDARWRNVTGTATFPVDDLDARLIAGKAQAHLRFSSSIKPHALRVTVRGTDGSATAELFQMTTRSDVTRRIGAQLSPLANQAINGAVDVARSARNLCFKVSRLRTPYSGLRRYLDETYAAWDDERPLPVTADAMLAVSSLIDALVEQRGVR